jgi:alginate O-acetyltransferase complex protein AlgJ
MTIGTTPSPSTNQSPCKGVPRVLALTGFLAALALVGIAQLVHDAAAGHSAPGETRWLAARLMRGRAGTVAQAWHHGHGGLGRVRAASRAIAAALREVGSGFEDGNVVSGAVRPWVQAALTRGLGAGNERALVGRGCWLFLRSEVEQLAGPGFLGGLPGGGGLAVRQRDPRPAILDFAEQLRARGVALVLVPVPGKASVYPERLSGRLEGAPRPIEDPSFAGFADEMRRSGVLVFDPVETLWSEKSRANQPAFLATDTHWSPIGMASVAAALARFVNANVKLPAVADPATRLEGAEVSGAGDLAVALGLPARLTLPRERVALRRVVERSDLLWRPAATADVLLLGDSFTNIYSFAAMGWGESSGLAEHLSHALGRPLDVIVRNDDGAFATRLILSHELTRGRDRLAGKRVVVWEFAARELSLGDWRVLPMLLGTPPPRRFVQPARGGSLEVSGTIAAMAPVPRPANAPYADYVVGLHLVDVTGAPGSGESAQALVFMLAMQGRVLTHAAHLRVGDRVALRLQAWADVASQYGYASRGELLEGDLMLEEPCWGEELTQ